MSCSAHSQQSDRSEAEDIEGSYKLSESESGDLESAGGDKLRILSRMESMGGRPDYPAKGKENIQTYLSQ